MSLKLSALFQQQKNSSIRKSIHPKRIKKGIALAERLISEGKFNELENKLGVSYYKDKPKRLRKPKKKYSKSFQRASANKTPKKSIAKSKTIKSPSNEESNGKIELLKSQQCTNSENKI